MNAPRTKIYCSKVSVPLINTAWISVGPPLNRLRRLDITRGQTKPSYYSTPQTHACVQQRYKYL